LTGHGCFGKYLRQINREPTTACHHCPVLCDTAQHTLEFCEAWCEQRRALRAVAEQDLSLPVLVSRMAGSEVWRTVAAFCEEVVLQETAERIRRQKIAAPPAPAGVAAAAADSSDEEWEPEDDGGDESTPPPSSPVPTVRRSRRLALARWASPPDAGELRRGCDVTPPP